MLLLTNVEFFIKDDHFELSHSAITCRIYNQELFSSFFYELRTDCVQRDSLFLMLEKQLGPEWRDNT